MHTCTLTPTHIDTDTYRDTQADTSATQCHGGRRSDELSDTHTTQRHTSTDTLTQTHTLT